VSKGLEGVRQTARRDWRLRFTALLHHITPQLLMDSSYSLKKNAAAGVDGVTWRSTRRFFSSAKSAMLLSYVMAGLRSDLIYDVGLFDGGDTADYLFRGYNVVAFGEARSAYLGERHSFFSQGRPLFSFWYDWHATY